VASAFVRLPAIREILYEFSVNREAVFIHMQKNVFSKTKTQQDESGGMHIDRLSICRQSAAEGNVKRGVWDGGNDLFEWHMNSLVSIYASTKIRKNQCQVMAAWYNHNVLDLHIQMSEAQKSVQKLQGPK
jgi:hypothetical protein